MVAHSRYASARHTRASVGGTYRVPDDVLVCILFKLDTVSLLRFCKAFDRAAKLSRYYGILAYGLELAGASKDDNPIARHITVAQKLVALRAYRKEWGHLQSGHEFQVKLPPAAVMGVSGGFLHRYYDAGGITVLELAELPSPRLDRAPSATRHLRFRLNGTNLRAFVYDPAQNLAVTCELLPQMTIRVSLREMPSFTQHSRAPHMFRDFVVCGAVEAISVTTCGALVCVTVRLSSGQSKVLLFNWKAFSTSWIKAESAYLISDRCALAVYHGRLRLFDVTDVLKPRTLREYALPDAWADRELILAPNASAHRPSPHALFHAAPADRVIVLQAVPAEPERAHSQSWLVIREAVFLGALRSEGRALEPWALWGARCAVKEVPVRARGPCVAGNRIVYAVGGRGGGAMLHAIEFSGEAVASGRPSAAWSWVGAAAGPMPVEVERALPAEPGEKTELKGVNATEDNVVLEYETRGGGKPAVVLTFGVHREI
ncbi:hypothetical protein HDZ31DRAFT_80137 [Schizophyllum fasciatum]